ncbi:uncharacterized protein HMPREF1541_08120 [Cyphellophora europaea CBS 101466]|uniref:S-adenosyl-L-methionine-dependent methyltransferase n=1 Tax=Cyphellophora europaea (strain CBS 101466) TaxID=1220924 RepID=W2RLD2_CYPE1|nr:uncharacterized protein HMPREF1541_08120 [Cyphellophora europaea CBS 101466]ETN37130.1 hypothetical protein HMPREF1541_08120 [Cyphellophora europaea CBS 101466]
MASAASTLASAGHGNERFNAEAAAWDKNPMVHEASREACTALLQRFSKLEIQAPGQGLDVLEIGCGTGLLSFNMAPFVRQIVAVDAAEGMIDVLKAKLQSPSPETPKNIVPLALLLEDPEDPHLPPATAGDASGPRLKYDLILSHLVLHHIPDLQGVLATMLGCLKPGGSVALTDFEDFGPEARRFHPKAKMAGVERHGIHPEEMTRLLAEVGFRNARVERAWAMQKQVETIEGEFGDKGKPEAGQGEVMNFPFVVCMGEKA